MVKNRHSDSRSDRNKKIVEMHKDGEKNSDIAEEVGL